MPKLIQERQRLEHEIKLLTAHYAEAKRRRRSIQALTKERVLKVILRIAKIPWAYAHSRDSFIWQTDTTIEESESEQEEIERAW